MQIIQKSCLSELIKANLIIQCIFFESMGQILNFASFLIIYLIVADQNTMNYNGNGIRIIIIDYMAFVYSEKRWPRDTKCITPGPGSHFTELTFDSHTQKAKLDNRSRIRKGRTPKIQQIKELIKYTQSPSALQTPNILMKEEEKKRLNQAMSYEEFNNFNHQLQMHKNPDFSRTKFIQISSLQPGIFLEIKGQKQEQIFQQQQKKQLLNLNFEARKTVASIKHVSSQKFYIGSKNQHFGIESCEQVLNLARQKKVKSKSQKKLYMHTKGHEQQFNSIKNSKVEQKKSKQHKPITEKHPFERNYQLYTPQSVKCQQNSTRIQQQGQQESQFIQDSSPGPGSYQISQINKQTTKKSLMFTQKIRPRFKQNENENKIGYQFHYYQKPCSKKSKSRASQMKVGFGRAVKQQSSGHYLQDHQRIQNCIFYENLNSIENKCIKVKIRDALNPGFFNIKENRFTKNMKKSHSNVNMNKKLYQSQNIQKLRKNLYTYRPTQPFTSCVPRQLQPSSLTSNVQYTGQNYKTIAKKIQYNDLVAISKPKYNYQLNQKEQQMDELQLLNKFKFKFKTYAQIKHFLVQDMYGFRQRESKKQHKKQQIKGYTFNQNENTKQKQKQNFPGPMNYHTQKLWDKTSYNIKFSGSHDYKQFKVLNQNLNLQNTQQFEPIKVTRI